VTSRPGYWDRSLALIFCTSSTDVVNARETALNPRGVAVIDRSDSTSRMFDSLKVVTTSVGKSVLARFMDNRVESPVGTVSLS